MLRALEARVADDTQITRRRFAGLGAAAVTAFGAGLTTAPLAAQATPGSGRGSVSATPRPEALRSEFLLDLSLETAPSISVGNRTVVAVTGGTFEGPRLKGTVVSPGADWPIRIDDTLRILDVRTLLVTDDGHKIYTTYRGVIYTPPAGQGERYWRTTPIFETDSAKYGWLNHMVAVGVSFTVPQRVSYRIFQIL